MKVAISATDKIIESEISDIFGRCPYFILVETEDGKIGKIEVIKNESTDQNSGAGVSTAQLMAENNVNAVITGNMGPRALDALKQFNIKIYLGKGIVKDTLQDLMDNKLKEIN
jgi:predicted Fe-Mo cluster-binding NifX family protein